MANETTLNLNGQILRALGLSGDRVQRLVLVLESGQLPTAHITTLVRPPLGEKGQMHPVTQRFDLVPHDRLEGGAIVDAEFS